VSRDQALQAYWQESASWDADRAAQAARTARIAWVTAGAGWTCAVTACAALMLLMPLKRVDPFLVRVDSTTGVVDVVPAYAGATQMAEPVTRYLLSHYVTVCERFNFATAESDYAECGAFNSPKRNAAWFSEWSTSNPSSPLNLYKDGTTISAQVTAVSFFKRASGLTDLAQVRYLKFKRHADGAPGEVTHWIATLEYGYGEPSKDASLRRFNPIGFRILDFHAEPEVLNESAAANTTPDEGGRP